MSRKLSKTEDAVVQVLVGAAVRMPLTLLLGAAVAYVVNATGLLPVTLLWWQLPLLREGVSYLTDRRAPDDAEDPFMRITSGVLTIVICLWAAAGAA